MTPEGVDLLVREYFALAAIYEDHNQQSLILKGWSVTVVAAAIFAAYAKPVSETAGRAGLLLAALMAVPFLLTDALWKSVQLAYLERLRAIETAFEGLAEPDPAVVPLQMFSGWSADRGASSGQGLAETLTGMLGRGGDDTGLFLQALLSWPVALPHGLLLVIGLALWRFAPPKISEPQRRRAGR